MDAGVDVFLSQKIVLILANSADPNEIQHYAAFRLAKVPACLPKFPVYKFIYLFIYTVFQEGDIFSSMASQPYGPLNIYDDTRTNKKVYIYTNMHGIIKNNGYQCPFFRQIKVYHSLIMSSGAFVI